MPANLCPAIPGPPLHAGSTRSKTRARFGRRAGLVERVARDRRAPTPCPALTTGRRGVWEAGAGAEVPFITALKHLCRRHPGCDGGDPRGQPAAIPSLQSESTRSYHPISPPVEARAEFPSTSAGSSPSTSATAATSRPRSMSTSSTMVSAEASTTGSSSTAETPPPLHPAPTTTRPTSSSSTPTAASTPSARCSILRRDDRLRARYHLPVMHTETNYPDPDAALSDWLWRQV